MVEHVQADCDERAKSLMTFQEATSVGNCAANGDKRKAPSKHAPVRIGSAPGSSVSLLLIAYSVGQVR